MINLIFNILFGLSIGIIVSYLFINKDKYHGPNSKDICKKIFRYNSKCYKLVPKIIKCSLLSYHY
jgi:hypothetical protein